MKQNVKLIEKNRTKCNVAILVLISDLRHIVCAENKNQEEKYGEKNAENRSKNCQGKKCVCFEFVQLPKIVLDYVLTVSKRCESFVVSRIFIRCIIHAYITKDFIAGLVTTGACNI